MGRNAALFTRTVSSSIESQFFVYHTSRQEWEGLRISVHRHTASDNPNCCCGRIRRCPTNSQSFFFFRFVFFSLTAQAPPSRGSIQTQPPTPTAYAHPPTQFRHT